MSWSNLILNCNYIELHFLKKKMFICTSVQPTVEITGLKVEFHLHTKKCFISYKLKKLTHVELLKIIL